MVKKVNKNMMIDSYVHGDRFSVCSTVDGFQLDCEDRGNQLNSLDS